MIVDILMALIVALLFEMLCLLNEKLRMMIAIIACVGIMVGYLKSGCQIDFIGTIDFSIWLLLVILFSNAFMLTKNIWNEIRNIT